ncbi:MAG: hypothetical protein Fur0022_09140 [Anaerolineales bacterium]
MATALAENRLIAVTKTGFIATFLYACPERRRRDGDSNGGTLVPAVKATLNGITTAFIGPHFEWTGSPSTMVKYAYAGAQRLAMRISSTANRALTWLFGDHLGSTSVSADYDGDLISTTLSKPWGEERYSSGTLPTDYILRRTQDRFYTSQYSHTADFGLMYYVARWYDPLLGRFAQADTMVPGAGNPLAWDRYAYTLNNPLRYIDPTGHDADCFVGEQDCDEGVHGSEDDYEDECLNQTIGCYPDPSTLEDDEIGELDPVAQVILSIASEPLDWLITIGTCNQEDCSWVTYALMVLPGLSGTMGRAADDVLDVAKAVCSFDGETLVMTKEGLKPIREIEVGELVLAYHEETGELGYFPVTATWEHEDPVLVLLTVDGETLTTTPDHPFYTSKGEWVQASDLNLGETVFSAAGEIGMVRDLEYVYSVQPMFNLTVAEAHTYFVGEGQWLVHNSCGGAEILSDLLRRVNRQFGPNNFDIGGTLDDAYAYWDEIALNADKISTIKGGWVAKFSDGTYVTFRPVSTSGHPALEVNIGGTTIKFKFVSP